MASNYIPSAGYMYDLLFMYKLYFNKGEWMTEFVLHKKAEQNRDFYVSIMKLFDTAPEEGALFFYVKDAGQTFMDTLLFEMMHCGEGLSFSEFRDAFKDGAVTKRKLFFYYLDQDIEQMSLAEAVGCIDRSAYPEGIKHLLISFLIREKDYVQSIAADLAVKDEIVSSYYEENKEILPRICATVSDETLQELTDRKDGAELRYGISLIGRNEIVTVESEEDSLVILGCDFQDVLEEQKEGTTNLDITGFGKVMSEPNRMVILDMLLENKELSTSEIAKRLRVSVNAAYYHLNMMTDIGMLYSRTEGRTVYFKINPSHFVAVRKALEKYLI